VLATDTLFGMEEELRFKGLRFRVRAPRTFQATPLQEYEGTDTRAVMKGKPLDIKNNPVVDPGWLCTPSCHTLPRHVMSS
jgi:hypothetical protein